MVYIHRFVCAAPSAVALAEWVWVGDDRYRVPWGTPPAGGVRGKCVFCWLGLEKAYSDRFGCACTPAFGRVEPR